MSGNERPHYTIPAACHTLRPSRPPYSRHKCPSRQPVVARHSLRGGPANNGPPALVNKTLRKERRLAPLNRSQNMDFPAETMKTAGRRPPAIPNPDRDTDDLTHPELTPLNRFASDGLR